jgi:hypothetical protein
MPIVVVERVLLKNCKILNETKTSENASVPKKQCWNFSRLQDLTPFRLEDGKRRCRR